VSHDGLGNVTGGLDAATFIFGAHGRMAQITEYTNDLYMTYNGLGELARTRLTTEDGCGIVAEINREYYHFATDGRALELVQENASRVQWDWVWLDNLPVLQFEDSYDGAGVLIGSRATYLHPDHLGTPRIGTDTAGALVWRYRSDGFGKATISGSHVVRLRLPGQVYLGFQALNYNYFRDYDPNLGRYRESDPIGLRGGSSTYGYATANPLARVDVNGLIAFWNMGRDWSGNGNYLPGFEDQDGECSSFAQPFNKWNCTKKCCGAHDACFSAFRCNQSSWFTRFGQGNELPCNVCNAKVVLCFVYYAGRDNCDDPNGCLPQQPAPLLDAQEWIQSARRRSSR